MEPWKLMSDAVTQTARTLVSRDKYRLKDAQLGVNLDLTYITDRIIAMGIPSKKFDSLYRNHENDVAKYFNARHPGKYMIFNLSEKRYSYSKFGHAVQTFGWPDHHAPTLPVLIDLVQAMASWLERSPDNVVAVHCKAGRGRTGTAISCLLYYMGISDSVSSALSFFAERRSKIGEGVEGPSQIRMCTYFQNVTLHGMPPSKPLLLTAVEFKPVPGVGIDSKFCPAFELCNPATPKRPFYANLGSEELRYRPGDYNAKIFCNQEIQGDVLFRVCHQTLVPGASLNLLFRVQVHTSFLKTPTHEFHMRDIDATHAGPLNDSRFPLNFTFTLHFGDDNIIEHLAIDSSPPKPTIQLLTKYNSPKAQPQPNTTPNLPQIPPKPQIITNSAPSLISPETMNSSNASPEIPIRVHKPLRAVHSRSFSCNPADLLPVTQSTQTPETQPTGTSKGECYTPPVPRRNSLLAPVSPCEFTPRESSTEIQTFPPQEDNSIHHSPISSPAPNFSSFIRQLLQSKGKLIRDEYSFNDIQTRMKNLYS